MAQPVEQAVAAPPQLVVRTDRARVNGLFTWIAILNGVVLIGMVVAAVFVAALSESMVAAAPLLLLVLSQVVQLGYYAYAWGQRVAVDVALVVSPGGIWFAIPGRGDMSLPWSAITGIRVRRPLGRRVLSIWLAPGVGPTTPGCRRPARRPAVEAGAPAGAGARLRRHRHGPGHVGPGRLDAVRWPDGGGVMTRPRPSNPPREGPPPVPLAA